MKSGIELIAEEVQHTNAFHKWDYKSEEYQHGQLAAAAACYAVSSVVKDRNDKSFVKVEVKQKIGEEYGFPIYSDTEYADAWPWGDIYDNRGKHDRIKSLIVAGALIAAEIDRLQAQNH